MTGRSGISSKAPAKADSGRVCRQGLPLRPVDMARSEAREPRHEYIFEITSKRIVLRATLPVVSGVGRREALDDAERSEKDAQKAAFTIWVKLLPSLLAGLKAVCAAFPDRRKGRGGNIAMADFGLSAFAMFFMQSASFLSFQGPGPIKLPEPVRHRENSVQQLHPRHARRGGPGAARALLRASGSSAGRAAFAPGPWQTGWQNAGRLGWDRVLLLAKARLPALPANVPTARLKLYHSMLAATVVAPSHAKIVPLMPEFIAPQDGAEKQDCGRNAVKRWFDKHHARLAPLRPAAPFSSVGCWGGITPTKSTFSKFNAISAEMNMSLGTVLLIILILVLLGALPTWPYSSGWGYYPSGGIGLVLIILVILLFTGRI